MFNPFYVKKRSKQIAHAITRSIIKKEYQPPEPHKWSIPKKSGGERNLTIFEIPDAAVSNYFYKQLLRKNRHRLSSFTYAYRDDRNLHFAIQDIFTSLQDKARMFVAEFDFSQFFSSISHGYLFEQFSQNGFSINESEEHIIKSFLGEGDSGIPEGTSISLFLANLVCWEMDKNLELVGLKFARYADDTIIWSPDYPSISQAYLIIENFSKKANVEINYKKSDGISLLCRDEMPAEITSKTMIDFLGYSISVDNISIKEDSVSRIKAQILHILYKHLIQPLKAKTLNKKAIPSNNYDPNLLSAILEIRRYLYGNLSESMVSNFLNGSSNRIFFKGLMSFYPLINNEGQMKELDGWLVTAIHKAVQKRSKILISKWSHNPKKDFPFNVKRNTLLEAYKSQTIDGKRLLQVPSFRRIYLALEKNIREHGIQSVISNNTQDYDY